MNTMKLKKKDANKLKKEALDKFRKLLISIETTKYETINVISFFSNIFYI